MTSKTFQGIVNDYMDTLYQQYYDSLDTSYYWTEVDYFGGYDDEYLVPDDEVIIIDDPPVETYGLYEMP